MEIEIGKWGNSVATRIPAELVRLSGLTVGAKAHISFEKGVLMIKPEKPKMSRRERYDEIIASYRRLGPAEEISSGPDVGAEIVEW